MHRKPWPVLASIALVLLLAAALLGRPRSAAPTARLSPTLTPSRRTPLANQPSRRRFW